MNTSAPTEKCSTSCARSLQSSIMTLPPYIFYVDFWMISPLSKNYEEYFLKCITSFYIVLQAKYWVFPLWFLHEYFSSNRKMPNLLCKILAKRSRLWLGRKCLSLGMWHEERNLWVSGLFHKIRRKTPLKINEFALTWLFFSSIVERSMNIVWVDDNRCDINLW